jgi:cytidine deaminase
MENASYGLTQCAERNAIAAAVVAGIRDLRAVLIYTPGNRVHAPCGACRQVIGEMMHPAARVISCCDSDEYSEWTVGELLPEPFEPEALLNP